MFFSIYVLKWYIFDIIGTIVISLRIKKLFLFLDVRSTYLTVMADAHILLNYRC
jgi:hypothetical protein